MRAAASLLGMTSAGAGGPPAQADVVELDCAFSSVCAPGEGCEDADFHLSFIRDSESQTTYMRGNNGASKVLQHAGETAVTFLETLGSGAVQSTTVSFVDGGAVHSRHTVIGGRIGPSQYFGSCLRK